MDAKEKLLRSIEDSLDEYARWARRAGGSRSDAVEEFYRELLNRAFGYDMKNMNRVKGNYPGIDLADEDAGVAVQVTTTETAEKVRKTLKQFLDDEKGLYRQYPRLIVAVAGDSKGKNSSYTTKGFDFQPRRDIWDIAGLVTEVCALPQEKLEDLEEFLTKRTSHLPVGDPVLQLPTPERRSSVEFLGREEELAWIEEELRRGTKPVIVAGLGGIGKTVLAVKFRRRWEGHVYFATFRESFKRTLADSVGMAIPVQERQSLNEEQTAELALHYLSRCEAGDLLIVDNAEVTGKKWRDLTKDPFYEKLRRLPMAVLMTTRHRDTGGKWLGRMALDELREIFRRHEVKISEGEMDRLIDAVDGHTMTVDMIARTIRESWGDVTAEDILAAMANSTLDQSDFDEIENDHDPEQGKIYAHLRALFDLSGISEDGKYALRCATLLPQNGMDEALFRHALPDGAAREIKKLEKKGWVDRKEGKVTIHPVVRLVCRTELEPSEENCEGFLDCIRNQYDPKRYDHVRFRQMAELFENAANTLGDRRDGFWELSAGYLWKRVGERERALVLELRALELLERFSPGSQDLATNYNNLSMTYSALGNQKKALEYQMKALAIREEIGGLNFTALANSYSNIGLIYEKLGEHEKALEYQTKALEIRGQIWGENHTDFATSYNNLGIHYCSLGNYEKALECLLKALEIREQILEENHPDIANSYNNVGFIYGKLGDCERALAYELKALEIRERTLGSENPEFASSYNNVGMTYYFLGYYEKALEYLLKALELFERVLGIDHTDLATSCDNIGGVYSSMGDHAKAFEYVMKAHSIRERVLPPDHPDLANSYNNVGTTYSALGDHKKTLEYLLKALSIWERVLPGNHPSIATSCCNIALTYYAQGWLEEAAEHMRRAADIINRSTLPEHHPDRVNFNKWAKELEEEARQARGGA